MRGTATTLLLLALVLEAGPALAQDASLQQAARVLREAVASGAAGGAIGLIARGDSVLFHEALGDFGDGTPLDRNAIVRLASITKPLTATAVLLLVERGVLRLDDTVNTWFPGFGARVAGPAGEARATRTITIRDLLTHTAGLPTEGAAYDSLFDAPTAQDYAIRIGRMPFRFQPGAGFEYGCCGSAYEVLGAIIERVTGLSYRDFLTENVLKPLGMHDTYFNVPPDKQSRLAAQYRRAVSGGLEQFRTRGQEEMPGAFYSGAGGLRSTVTDYLRFTRFLLHGGTLDGVRLLSAASVRMMTTDQVAGLYPAAGLGWGMGVQVRTAADPASRQRPGSFGWNGGTGTMFVVDPAADLIAIVFIPTNPGTPGVNAARRAFVEAAYLAERR